MSAKSAVVVPMTDHAGNLKLFGYAADVGQRKVRRSAYTVLTIKRKSDDD